jgi:hypothetical protein
MSECSLVLTFLKHLVILGVIGGGFATALECRKGSSGGTGFVYGLFPGTFVYLFIVALIYGGNEGASGFGRTAIIGGILWVLFVAATLAIMYSTKQLGDKTSATLSLSVSSVFLIFCSVMLYTYLKFIKWIE